MVEGEETEDCGVVLRGCGQELKALGYDVLVGYYDLYQLC